MHLKLFLIIVLFLLFIPIVLSQDIRFYGKQNNNLTIKDTCSYNGFSCDNTFVCNFTILKPDQTYLIEQGTGTKQGDYWNYSLHKENTSIVGLYETTLYCSNESNSGKDTFYFQVTKDGNEPPSSVYGFSLMLVILGIIGLFFYIALKIDNKYFFVKYLFLLIVFILFSVEFYIARDIAQANFSSAMGNLFDILFRVYLYIMMFIILMFIVYTIAFILKAMATKKKERIFGDDEEP